MSRLTKPLNKITDIIPHRYSRMLHHQTSQHMKKLIIILFLAIPFSICAQKLSNAYIGAMLHDLDQPGISLVNSFGVSPYLGLGAGVDITSYKSGLMVPIYFDVRGKIPVNNWTPFINGQFGKPLYNHEVDLEANSPTGDFKAKAKGQYFYGAGGGVSYKHNKVGVFLSYTQRFYQFKYDDINVNGQQMNPDKNKSMGIITAGLVF